MRRRFTVIALAGAVATMLLALLVGLGATHIHSANAAGPGPTPTPTPFVCPGPWYTIASPNPGANVDELDAVAAVTPNDVWAVGLSQDIMYDEMSPLFEHWDGHAWSVASYAANGVSGSNFVGVTAISKHDVWAVGSNGGAAVTAHWDGATWQLAFAPTPADGNYASFKSVSATAADDVWAVGLYISGGFWHTLIEHWDGSAWSIVPSPNQENSGVLQGVVALSPSDVWAVGYYQRDGVYEKYTLVEHWDGSAWSIVPSPNRGQYQDNVLTGVAAVSAQDIWAVGYVTDAQTSLTEHWDGSAWSEVAAPPPAADGYGTTLLAVAVAPDRTVWAVGGQTIRWDGSSWTSIPAPVAAMSDSGVLNGVVALSPSNVWAVGSTGASTAGTQRSLTMQYRPPDHGTGMGNGTQCPHSNLGSTQP